MNIFTIIGLLGAVITIAGYAVTSLKREARWFDWANAVGVWPIAASCIYVDAWPALVVTLFFGGIGFLNVLARRKRNRAELARLAEIADRWVERVMVTANPAPPAPPTVDSIIQELWKARHDLMAQRYTDGKAVMHPETFKRIVRATQNMRPDEPVSQSIFGMPVEMSRLIARDTVVVVPHDTAPMTVVPPSWGEFTEGL